MSEKARIRDRLEEQAIRLDSGSPDAKWEDAIPFLDRISSRSIIGLGESAHGTSEFPQLKHRFVRELLGVFDLDVVAWETSFPETIPIADYVVGRTDDRSTAYAPIRDHPWKGSEWLELVEWLRDYNVEKPAASRVPLHGFTKSYSGRPARVLREYLERADSRALDGLDDQLAILAQGFLNEQEMTLYDDRVQVAEEIIPGIRDRLSEGRNRQIKATSEAEWERVRHHVRILDQVCELRAAHDDPEQSHRALRDRFMAVNVDWILDYVDAERAVISAANSHIQDGPSPYSSLDCPLLGSYLRDQFGRDYYTIALDFGHGTVRAHRDQTEMNGLEIADIEFQPPHNMGVFDGALDSWGSFTEADLAHPQLHAVLAECDFETAILDFEMLREDETLAKWLEKLHLLHGVGSRHWPSKPERSVSAYVLPDQFDALLYKRKIHPVTPTD